jgi:hypothetical protein
MLWLLNLDQFYTNFIPILGINLQRLRSIELKAAKLYHVYRALQKFCELNKDGFQKFETGPF